MAFELGLVRTRPPLEPSYCTLDLVPLKGVPSVSSLSVLTIIESRISTRDKDTFASVGLNLPPSSWNFKRYVPGRAGAITSVELPATASITS